MPLMNCFMSQRGTSFLWWNNVSICEMIPNKARLLAAAIQALGMLWIWGWTQAWKKICNVVYQWIQTPSMMRDFSFDEPMEVSICNKYSVDMKIRHKNAAKSCNKRQSLCFKDWVSMIIAATCTNEQGFCICKIKACTKNSSLTIAHRKNKEKWIVREIEDYARYWLHHTKHYG